jgi:hypothetical protein
MKRQSGPADSIHDVSRQDFTQQFHIRGLRRLHRPLLFLERWDIPQNDDEREATAVEAIPISVI